jgi:hypothetical protein
MPIQYDDRYIVKPGRQIQFTAHMLQELARCASDITYFAEKYYTIIHPVRGEEVINLFPFQREMLENMRNNRQNLIMAARQLGKCVHFDTIVEIMNKETGEVTKMKIGDFFEKIKVE